MAQLPGRRLAFLRKNLDTIITYHFDVNWDSFWLVSLVNLSAFAPWWPRKLRHQGTKAQRIAKGSSLRFNYSYIPLTLKERMLKEGTRIASRKISV